MMVRTQIMLEAEEHRRAKQRAAELGLSLAAYIRQVVSSDLHAPAAHIDRGAVIGLFDSGGSDVGRHKDDYLAEALGDKLARGRRER